MVIRRKKGPVFGLAKLVQGKSWKCGRLVPLMVEDSSLVEGEVKTKYLAIKCLF